MTTTQSDGIAVEFLSALTHELGTSYKPDDLYLADLEVYYADFSPLQFRLSSNVPCIRIKKADVDRFDIHKVAEMVEQEIRLRQDRPATSIILTEVDADFLEHIRHDPYWSIVIDHNQMQAMLDHSNPKRWIIEELRKQVYLRFLSPFEPRAPVVGRNFVGRKFEKNLIREHTDTNFSIEGGRRIGKTSLILEARREMSELIPEKQLPRIVKFNFWGYQGNYKAFLLDVIRHFREVPGPKLYKGSLYDYFPRFIERMKQRYGRINFFIDEVDDLIEYERANNSYRLLNLFKKIADEQNARFTIAGFRLLTEERLNHRSPIRKFRPLELSTLTNKQAQALLINPLRNMGIEIMPGVFKDVLDSSGCHPQILQLFGQLFTELLDQDKERTISHRHVAEVMKSGKVHEVLYDTIVENTTDLELALVGSLADHEVFDEMDIDKIVKGHSIDLSVKEIQRICRYLIGMGIMRRSGQDTDTYQFVIPLQPVLLSQKTSTMRLAWEKAKKKLENEAS